MTWRDSDGYGIREAEAWSGITGWRFESSSAYHAKAPHGGALSFLGVVLPERANISWQRLWAIRNSSGPGSGKPPRHGATMLGK
jgi:hypothetical protein